MGLFFERNWEYERIFQDFVQPRIQHVRMERRRGNGPRNRFDRPEAQGPRGRGRGGFSGPRNYNDQRENQGVGRGRGRGGFMRGD